jgi:hypothetical protein
MFFLMTTCNTLTGVVNLRHASAIIFRLAEVAVTGEVVRVIFAAIDRQQAPPRCA